MGFFAQTDLYTSLCEDAHKPTSRVGIRVVSIEFHQQQPSSPMSSIIDLIVSSSPVKAHPSCPVEAHPSSPVEAFAKGSGAVFPSKAPSDHVRQQMDSAAESVHTVV